MQALRYYERERLLLDPTPHRNNGHRRFHRYNPDWLACLVMLRETRMPLAEVRDVAALSRNPGSEAERLKAFEANRETVVAQLKRTVIWLTRVPSFGKPGDSPGSLGSKNGGAIGASARASVRRATAGMGR